MDKGNVHIDDQLLMKFLAGEADENEKLLVEEWQGMSEDNRQKFNRLKVLAGDRYAYPEADVDVDRAWGKMQARMEKHQGGAKVVQMRKSPAYYLLRIAAVFVFGVLAIGFYKYKFRTEHAKIVASTSVIEKTLTDGSQISLNSGAEIEYPEKFDKKVRSVKLTGEAFFAVEANKEKPFVIETPDIFVKVLGTEFNVNANPENDFVEVLVEEGIVEMSADAGSIKVLAGEKGFYDKKEKTFTKEKAFDPNKLFWKHKTLVFSKTELSVVFLTLEDLFNVKIHVSDPSILKCRLSGRFRDEGIEEIIKNILINFNLEYEKTDNVFNIEGNGC